MTSLEQLLERYNTQDNNFKVTINNIEYDCKRLPFAQILSIDDNHDVDTEKGGFERAQEVIYMSCPMFQNALNAVEHHGEPFKIVGKLLQPLEVYGLYQQILSHYMNITDLNVDNVKKS